MTVLHGGNEEGGRGQLLRRKGQGAGVWWGLRWGAARGRAGQSYRPIPAAGAPRALPCSCLSDEMGVCALVVHARGSSAQCHPGGAPRLPSFAGGQTEGRWHRRASGVSAALRTGEVSSCWAAALPGQTHCPERTGLKGEPQGTFWKDLQHRRDSRGLGRLSPRKVLDSARGPAAKV